MVAWEHLATSAETRMEVLSYPSAILAAIVEMLVDGTLLTAVPQTFGAAIWGMAVGAAAGVVIGIAFGMFPLLSRLMRVTTESLRPIPSIALIPLALLIHGFGYAMESSIVAIACFFPLLIITENAVHGVEPRLLEVARALGFGVVNTAVKIVLPAVLPQVFVGLRLAAAIALVVAVTVEITANPLGLGYALIVEQQSLRPDRVFALIFWIGLIGWLLHVFLTMAQSQAFGRAGRWAEQRQ